MRTGYFQSITADAIDAADDVFIMGDSIKDQITSVSDKTRNITSSSGGTFFSGDILVDDGSEMFIRSEAIIDLQSEIVEVTADEVNIKGTQGVKINGVDVVQEISYMNSQLQILRLDYPEKYKVRYPRVPLVNRDRVTASTTYIDVNFSSHQPWDDVYGPSVTNATNPVYLSNSWMSAFPTDVGDGEYQGTSTISIDGSGSINGEFVYIDIGFDSTRAIMSSFQFYAPDDTFPIEYWIIGSNDASSWTGFIIRPRLLSLGPMIMQVRGALVRTLQRHV
jgi:hypothetical protein